MKGGGTEFVGTWSSLAREPERDSSVAENVANGGVNGALAPFEDGKDEGVEAEEAWWEGLEERGSGVEFAVLRSYDWQGNVSGEM